MHSWRRYLGTIYEAIERPADMSDVPFIRDEVFHFVLVGVIAPPNQLVYEILPSSGEVAPRQGAPIAFTEPLHHTT